MDLVVAEDAEMTIRSLYFHDCSRQTADKKLLGEALETLEGLTCIQKGPVYVIVRGLGWGKG